MIFLCVMGFVKYQEVYLLHPDEGAQETLLEDFCRTDNHHIIIDTLRPDILIPESDSH